MPLGIGLAISGGASLLGGLFQSGASTSAAKQQAQAAEYAANLQYAESQQANALIQQIYGQNVARLAPFVTGGQSFYDTAAQGVTGMQQGINAIGTLTGTGGGGNGNPLTSPLTAPFQPTMAQLSQTPGYQFALQQGLLAVGAGSSAQGMGSAVSGAGAGNTVPGVAGIGPSGPLGKGLANYAEGLASTTYQQQFQNYLTQNQQIYNILAGYTGLGQNLATTGLSGYGLGAGAAAGTGQLGATAGGQSANALLQGAQGYGSYSTAGAAATAAGTVGSASALSNALGGVGNSALLYGVLGGGGNAGALGVPNFTDAQYATLP